MSLPIHDVEGAIARSIPVPEVPVAPELTTPPPPPETALLLKDSYRLLYGCH